MSLVVVRSQMWIPELSVEFFNVNCKRQAAVGRRRRSGRPLLTTHFCVQSHFYGECFCDLERTSCFNNSSTFQTKIEILRLLWKMFFYPGSVLLIWRDTPPHPDHHQTITQYENRDFDVFKENVFFDLADIQASKQTFYSGNEMQRPFLYYRWLCTIFSQYLLLTRLLKDCSLHRRILCQIDELV